MINRIKLVACDNSRGKQSVQWLWPGRQRRTKRDGFVELSKHALLLQFLQGPAYNLECESWGRMWKKKEKNEGQQLRNANWSLTNCVSFDQWMGKGMWSWTDTIALKICLTHEEGGLLNWGVNPGWHSRLLQHRVLPQGHDRYTIIMWWSQCTVQNEGPFERMTCLFSRKYWWLPT